MIDVINRQHQENLQSTSQSSFELSSRVFLRRPTRPAGNESEKPIFKKQQAARTYIYVGTPSLNRLVSFLACIPRLILRNFCRSFAWFFIYAVPLIERVL